jgi:hypothetical protein
MDTMNDPSLLRIDDREEVRLLHAGAAVQAGDVEELLGRRAGRLLAIARTSSRNAFAMAAPSVVGERWSQPVVSGTFPRSI